MGCCTSHNEVEPKLKVIFVLGGPGAGKGTQCAKMKKDFNFFHLSTGDILREEASNKNNPKAAEINAALQAGKLFSSEELVTLIKKNFESKGNNGTVLLDGFPRCQDNLDAWENIIKDSVEVPFLLYFNCSEKCMKERLINRGKTSGRVDDNEETIMKRFKTFNEQTAPIAQKYRDMKMLVEIDGEREIDVIYSDIKKVLLEKKVIE